MTEGELLAILQGSARDPAASDALTMEEMAEMLDMMPETLRRKVRRLIRAGKMEAFRDWRETVLGYRQRYPVYRLKT